MLRHPRAPLRPLIHETGAELPLFPLYFLFHSRSTKRTLKNLFFIPSHIGAAKRCRKDYFFHTTTVAITDNYLFSKANNTEESFKLPQ